MNIAEIKNYDIANGPGVRVSLFVSGCRHKCKGCFNAEAQAFDFGTPFDETTKQNLMAALRSPYIDGLSILGGEPLEPENQEGLLDLTSTIREKLPNKTIWLWTGFTFEQLMSSTSRANTPALRPLLENLHVMVDGPYVETLHDISLRFRGSKNQRIISVPLSLHANEVLEWHDDIVFETHTM